MACNNRFSDNTTEYLNRYECILKEMIKNMTDAKQKNSISGSFIRQMIPHHQAAIEMSENLLRYTTNISLQNIAQNIISSQEKSIQNMLEAAPCCQMLDNIQEEVCCYQKKNDEILQVMFKEMTCACKDNCIDGNFIREMIPHHKGAIKMSENALDYCLCQELVPILEAIITSQKRGVKELHRLLTQVYC